MLQSRPMLQSKSKRIVRALSSDGNNAKENIKTGAETGGEDATKEIVLTPGEQVVVASRLVMWTGIAAFGAVCASYIGKELIPT